MPKKIRSEKGGGSKKQHDITTLFRRVVEKFASTLTGKRSREGDLERSSLKSTSKKVKHGMVKHPCFDFLTLADSG